MLGRLATGCLEPGWARHNFS